LLSDEFLCSFIRFPCIAAEQAGYHHDCPVGQTYHIIAIEELPNYYPHESNLSNHNRERELLREYKHCVMLVDVCMFVSCRINFCLSLSLFNKSLLSSFSYCFEIFPPCRTSLFFIDFHIECLCSICLCLHCPLPSILLHVDETLWALPYVDVPTILSSSPCLLK
jgi:hypothetical protein